MATLTSPWSPVCRIRDARSVESGTYLVMLPALQHLLFFRLQRELKKVSLTTVLFRQVHLIVKGISNWIWRCVYRASYCSVLIWRCVYHASYCNVLMTNEMHSSYNQYCSTVLLSAVHVSKESSRSPSRAQHNALHCTVWYNRAGESGCYEVVGKFNIVCTLHRIATCI